MLARDSTGTVLQVPLQHTDVQANVRGYLATVKSGEVVLCDGDDQGARPGKLLRGAR